MASPDVFLSSPSRAGRGGTHVTISSSPDLPSLQEILSQRPKRPPLRTGSKAAPIPENATTTFTSAGSLWRSLQGSQEDAAKRGSAAQLTVQEAVECVGVQAPAVKTPPSRVPNLRKPGRRKKTAPEHFEATTEPRPRADSTPNKDQPWKKFKSPSRGISNNATEPTPVTGTGSAEPESVPVKETETVSSHFFKSPEPQKPRKTKATKEEADGPLYLEPAMSRRMDWTPPAPRTQIILDSDTPGLKESQCSQGDDASAESFETMLASFKCEGTLQQETITVPDEDLTFLKKRKLIELVRTKATSAPEPSKLEKSPTKQKAPKKKPRTITGIATAAYRPLTQPDQDPVAAMMPESEAWKPTGSGKGKTKTGKRALKAPKKKVLPSKPILLSPGAALKLVAGQDFVFGTSSQLAREHSPSLLRDLQAAMKASNELDGVEFVTPVNSDAIEPPENRQALWEAGARDADGDLFDVDVLDLADGSPRLPEPAAEADPFGYVQGTDDPAALPDLPPANDVQDDDSFVNLSDILPAPDRGKPMEMVDDESHLFGSDLRTGTPSVNGKQHVGLQKEGEGGEKPAGEGIERPPVTSGPPSGLPAYELCSDAQLAKQVAQYGFKPIKKRTAMIALLEKCRQERARIGQGGVRSASTLAAATRASECTSEPWTKSASNSTPAKVKRPRGRPRKSSIGEGDVMKSVPSAQPPQSPKRPRGRPRKDAAAPPSKSSTATQAKKALCTETGQAPTTPKRKCKAPRNSVVEIADSESDVAADLSESACSSPDATFSPPQPVDLGLCVGEDTELSLTMSPTDQQTTLFTHITKAVTTAPRTTDPMEPSWHEKMLLYDPIVLEDLTVWLNSGQLTRIGYDGEASVGDVKKWCESKSICCLGRVNLRGKERKRY